MSIIIRPAQEKDTESISDLVNRFAAQEIMLPRTVRCVQQTLHDWLVAVESDAVTPTDSTLGTCDPPEAERAVTSGVIVGCCALLQLTETLAEVRSLAVAENQHGRGIGSQLVRAIVDRAQTHGFSRVCALTMRETFFLRLGFHLVDRWSISPKVWQSCIYCPKFHRCDEVAVMMEFTPPPLSHRSTANGQKEGWHTLMKWDAWQPLRLAYQQQPASAQSQKHADRPSTATNENKWSDT